MPTIFTFTSAKWKSFLSLISFTASFLTSLRALSKVWGANKLFQSNIGAIIHLIRIFLCDSYFFSHSVIQFFFELKLS